MSWTPPVTHAVQDFIDAPDWNNEITENHKCIVAAASTTVTGLDTVWGGANPPDGAIGRIKVGSTPFDFLDMRYDAGLGKWVSGENWYSLQTATWDVTSQAVDTLVAVGNPLQHLLPYDIYTAAGLTLEAKCQALVKAVATGTTSTNGLYPGVYLSDTGATSLTAINQTFLAPAIATGLPATAEVRGSDWGELAAVTATDYVMPFAFIRQFGTGTANFTVGALTIGLRWIG